MGLDSINKNNVLQTANKPSLNIKDQVVKYLKKWYWFVLSMLVFGMLAYTYIRYTIPLYNVSSTIIISEEENISESGFSAFKDLGLLDKSSSKIENEIQVIRSRTLISNVVKKLKLNIQYFSEGRILEVENYPKSAVEINFLSADSIVHSGSKVLNVLINSSTSFSFVDDEGIKLSTHSFGKTISTPSIGDIVITPSVVTNASSNKGKVVKIVISPIVNVTENYRNRINVFPLGAAGSSVVHISLNDPVKEKAKDIINNLVDEYTNATIENKKKVSDRTAKFINERIKLISGDLDEVDNEAAGYRSKFGLTNDIESQAQRVAESDSRNIQEIENYNTQLSLIESMRGFILSQEGKNDPIPSNLGFEDATISGAVAKYNSLIFQRKRLLKASSEQNPVVINVNEELDGLRQVLIAAINSLRGSINIRLNSLNAQDKYFSGKLYSAPTRQKDIKGIERQQTIKEQLYLYLLQKREEAEITSNITVSNSRVIDRASIIGSLPISPNKKMIYISALFFGFIIPFICIYLSNLLNMKVTSKEDLERVLSMPIIGSIPKTKVKKKIEISRTNRSSVSEAFRILRTNIDFLLAANNKTLGKVIFVTSTISGEGKTLVSANLAKALAISGNRVAYVGTDFRAPKFYEILELPNGKDTVGLTSFIMDLKLKPKDIIYKEKGTEDLIDIIPAGAIPPNPAELIMHDRVKEMFTYLEENYDYVVVDTAPVSLVADTLLISSLADLSIYVVRENYSDKRALQIPENFYREKRLPNMALLLNDAKNNLGGVYGYGYGKK